MITQLIHFLIANPSMSCMMLIGMLFLFIVSKIIFFIDLKLVGTDVQVPFFLKWMGSITILRVIFLFPFRVVISKNIFYSHYWPYRALIYFTIISSTVLFFRIGDINVINVQCDLIKTPEDLFSYKIIYCLEPMIKIYLLIGFTCLIIAFIVGLYQFYQKSTKKRWLRCFLYVINYCCLVFTHLFAVYLMWLVPAVIVFYFVFKVTSGAMDEAARRKRMRQGIPF